MRYETYDDLTDILSAMGMEMIPVQHKDDLLEVSWDHDDLHVTVWADQVVWWIDTNARKRCHKKIDTRSRYGAWEDCAKRLSYVAGPGDGDE